jgi:hypothetical protein
MEKDYFIRLDVVVTALSDVEAQRKAIRGDLELYHVKHIEQLEPWTARLKHHSMSRHPSRRTILW